MPLTIQHQADSAGDKAVSLIADNSGSNVAAAFKGVNKATQNGDTVADLVVSLDGETVDLSAQFVDGATFTRSSSKLLAGLAGVFESTVTTLTAGKISLARLTGRGAVVTAADVMPIVLYDAAGGTSNSGEYPVSASGTIRDTAAHDTSAAVPGYGKKTLMIVNGLDQAVTLIIWARNSSGQFNQYLYYGSTAIAAGTAYTAGNFTAAVSGVVNISIPALDWPWYELQFRLVAAGTPTTGDINVSMAVQR